MSSFWKVEFRHGRMFYLLFFIIFFVGAGSLY